MIKWIRGKRFDLRTTAIVIFVVLVAWAFVIYASVHEFIPDEFTEEVTP